MTTELLDDIKCNICGDIAYYNYTYDSICCKKCNIWIERKCTDPECRFCVDRPETPILEFNTLINTTN